MNMTNNNLINTTDKAYQMIRQEYHILLFSPFGSWNYWLAKEWKSDFDFIVVVIPNKYDMINRTVINKTVEHSFWTWWKIDVKDIYTFFKSIEGLNYLEALLWAQYSIYGTIKNMDKLKEIMRNYIQDNKYIVAKRIEAQLVHNAKKVLDFMEQKNKDEKIDENKLRKTITECLRLDSMLINFIHTSELKFKVEDKKQREILEIRYWKVNYDSYLPSIFNIANFWSIIPEHWKNEYKKDYKEKFRNIRNNILLELEIC